MPCPALLRAWSRAAQRGAVLRLARHSAMLRQRRSGSTASARSGRWPRRCPGSARRWGCPWLHRDVYVVLLYLRVLRKGLLRAHKGEEVVGEQLKLSCLAVSFESPVELELILCIGLGSTAFFLWALLLNFSS